MPEQEAVLVVLVQHLPRQNPAVPMVPAETEATAVAVAAVAAGQKSAGLNSQVNTETAGPTKLHLLMVVPEARAAMVLMVPSLSITKEGRYGRLSEHLYRSAD